MSAQAQADIGDINIDVGSGGRSVLKSLHWLALAQAFSRSGKRSPLELEIEIKVLAFAAAAWSVRIWCVRPPCD